MKTTINGINMELTTRVHNAPMDTNGNARWDIEVFANGDRYNKTVKGYRRVKNGYRVQAASHAYSVETAIKDLLDAIVEQNQPTQPKTTAHGTFSSTHATVVEKIQDHILESLSDDYGTQPKEQLESVVAGFRHWYGPYEQRHNQNVQAAFAEWLRGLPSELHFSPYYSDMREQLENWMGKSRKEFSDDQVAERYYQLVFREFQKMCKKYGVQDLYGRSNA